MNRAFRALPSISKQPLAGRFVIEITFTVCITESGRPDYEGHAFPLRGKFVRKFEGWPRNRL
jgi:hypothetical protein